MNKIMLFLFLAGACNPLTAQSNAGFLKSVLHQLNDVKGATYMQRVGSKEPGDKQFQSFGSYYKEVLNPADPTIGSSFAWFSPIDTARLEHFYDGRARGYVNKDLKTITVDSFKTSRTAFRPVDPPFYNYAKSILRYILETTDSIDVKMTYYKDSVHCRLDVINEVVEFFGHDTWHTPANHIQMFTDKPFSHYDIWIGKHDLLPYRIVRQMPHNESFRYVMKPKIYKSQIPEFNATKYLPVGFRMISSADAGKLRKESHTSLLGNIAPEWTLVDGTNKPVSLTDLKSKVILVQFTGIGCGACHASIPIVKEIVNDYHGKNFEFISIETWRDDTEALQRYRDKYNLSYRFLRATKEIVAQYKVDTVPVIFILDRHRTVRKVITGYTESMDSEIRRFVDELL